MLGKILNLICTRLRSTEIALDSLSLVQYDFCRTKTRANKIPYFTKHYRITYKYYLCACRQCYRSVERNFQKFLHVLPRLIPVRKQSIITLPTRVYSIFSKTHLYFFLFTEKYPDKNLGQTQIFNNQQS